MYADPSRARRFDPASFTAALTFSGLFVAGIMFAAPKVIPAQLIDPMPIRDYKDPPPPPPVPETKPKVEPKTATVIDPPPLAPDPIVKPPVDTGYQGTTTTDLHVAPPQPGISGTETIKVEPAPALPPLRAAIADSRYSGDFQPEYPASEIRLGREGKVTVRVRIGVDGRVKEVEQLSATSPAFFEATRKQAIGRWRFKPATRGNTPEESWKVMNVTFVLNNGG